MAFRSNEPVTLALPAFRGVTRSLILTAIVAFLVLRILAFASPQTAGLLLALLGLSPAAMLWHPWQPITYSFVDVGLLSVLLSLLSVWMFGSTLEDEMGPRWFTEFFFAATIGGGVLAGLVASVAGRYGSWLSPFATTFGMWPATMAILLAYARLFPDREILFVILRVKARHLAAIYLLVYLALALLGGSRFPAVTVLAVALAGWLYMRFAPRRGLGFAASEGVFGLRNAWYRAKRRRAAKKFTVYMRKQGKDVNLDASGRYIGLDDEKRRGPRDPNDKRWMN